MACPTPNDVQAMSITESVLIPPSPGPGRRTVPSPSVKPPRRPTDSPRPNKSF